MNVTIWSRRDRVKTLPHEPLLLGEGPRWDGDAGRVLLVDILGGCVLHGSDLDALDRTDVDGHVGAVAPVRGEAGRLVAGVGEAVGVLDLASGALEILARPEADRAGAVRMNDGACDPAGRFVVGSIAHSPEPGTGCLHRVGADGGTEVLLDDCTIPNGLVWIDDGATLLHVDSGPGTLTAYPYDERGALGPARVRYRHDGTGSIDGLCLADDGSLWVAVWGGARLLHLAPDGEVLGQVEVAARQPTACWFVGPARDRLLVTSATVGLGHPGPADGRSVLVDVGGVGVPATPFVT